jgi:hypothetical protein
MTVVLVLQVRMEPCTFSNVNVNFVKTFENYTNECFFWSIS